ncbi:MAG: hypothetical protein ACODAJ_11620 [Planctomycetota bacterium]
MSRATRATFPLVVSSFLALLTFGRGGHAGTSLGDAGHYLNTNVPILLNNPQGKAFAITLYRFQWPIGGGWNRDDMAARVLAPGGDAAFDKTVRVPDDGYTIRVPAGARGVYRLEIDARNGLNYWYATTSLSQAVAWAGEGTGDALRSHWFVCNPFVPRTWHFFVPEGTRRFRIRAQNNHGRSQREDHGITVFSPRGQRMGCLWGTAAWDAPKVKRDAEATRGYAHQTLEVTVEPGSDGRFWAVELRMGDSHVYSDVNLHLDGVPPYLARSPEAWFDPRTGRRPDLTLYDEDEFIQSDRSDAARAKHPLVEHWTPCPAIGDPDGCEIRCPARVAFWNPEGRRLRFVIGTYLPRNMFPKRNERRGRGAKRLPAEEHDHAALRWVGADGQVMLREKAPLFHLHGHERWERPVSPGRGVSRLDVTEAEHFWLYTYPATPVVLVGREIAGGWRRFHLDVGHARNWYCFVPEGTEELTVRVRAKHETDVVRLEVNAPDRVMAMLYANAGTRTAEVPEGLDGRMWHVRMDWGGASRPFGRLPRPRFPSIVVTLDLKGVPGYLAPTWEQWFDPREPAHPFQRGQE